MTRLFSREPEANADPGNRETRLFSREPKASAFQVDVPDLSEGPGLIAYDVGIPLSRCFRIDPSENHNQPGKRESLAQLILTAAEFLRFQALKGPDHRQREWLLGRLAAKEAIRSLWREKFQELLVPAQIDIKPDQYGRPVARYRRSEEPNGESKASDFPTDRHEDLPAISIAHSGGSAVALAAFYSQPGVDLEQISNRGQAFEKLAFDAVERDLLDQFGTNRDEGTTRFWCAREAVAKSLGRGMPGGPRSLLIRRVDVKSGKIWVGLGPFFSSLYPHLQSALIVADTIRDGDFILATTKGESLIIS